MHSCMIVLFKFECHFCIIIIVVIIWFRSSSRPSQQEKDEDEMEAEEGDVYEEIEDGQEEENKPGICLYLLS